MSCELCEAINDNYRIVCQDEYSFAIIKRDLQVDNHMLVLPKRHVENWDELTPEESLSLHKMVAAIRERISEVVKDVSVVAAINFERISQQHIHYQILSGDFGIWELVESFLRIEDKPKFESWDGSYMKVSKEEKAEMADKFRFRCQ